jgi:hypothetical protein
MRRHVTGIRVVPVNGIRQPVVSLGELDRLVHEFIQVGPEQLFSDVFAPAALDADNPELVVHRLYGHPVIVGHAVVVDEPRHQVDLPDLRVPAQLTAELQHVFDLAAGIGIAPQLDVLPRINPWRLNI